MVRKRIQQALWFLIENGPTILTIGFAAYVIALAQTASVPTDTLLQWILAILGLLAISELIERLRRLRRLEEMGSETLEAVRSRFGERPRAEDSFMRRLPPLEPHLRKAKDIRFSGYSLQCHLSGCGGQEPSGVWATRYGPFRAYRRILLAVLYTTDKRPLSGRRGAPSLLPGQFL